MIHEAGMPPKFRRNAAEMPPKCRHMPTECRQNAARMPPYAAGMPHFVLSVIL